MTDASKVMKNWEPMECGEWRMDKSVSVMERLFIEVPTIRIRSSVSHRKETSLSVLGGEVLIRKFGTVNRLP